MTLTNDTVMLFLLLMPGFMASIILNAIIVRKPPGGLMLVIEALVFSFVIYVCWGVLSGQLLVTVGASGAISPGEISQKSLAGVVGLSIILPLMLGVLLTHDYLFRMLNWLKVTRRTGRASAWLDVFVDQQRCVIVNFTDGRRLFGWPEYYSDDVNEGILFLSSPQWIDDDGNYIPLKMRGFLITNRQSIESVVFTHIGYDNVEFENYGEQSPAQPDDRKRTELFSGDRGTESISLHQRKEPAPESTDQTSAGSPSSPAEEELVRRAYAKE